MTPTKHVQLILDEIVSRYDQAIADHVWSRTEIKVSSYLSADAMVDHSSPSSANPSLELSMLQLISIFKVMDEEGFSPSERGSILMTAFESITGEPMSARAWREINDAPVYGTSQFSQEVKAELWRRVNSDASRKKDSKET